MSLSCGARRSCRRVPTVDEVWLCVVPHARMQHQQEFTRGPVSAMDSEAPAAQIRFGADRCPVTLDDALIIVAPRFSAAGSNAAGAFRLYKLDTAGIRKAFFSRINDLHDVSVRAGGRKLGDCVPHLANGGPQVRQHHDFGYGDGTNDGGRLARSVGS